MRRLAYGVPILAALAVFPFAVAEYPVLLAVEVIIFAIYALGINFLLGYTGLISLGHAMFLGLGGYGLGVCSVLLGLPVLPSMVATLLIVALLPRRPGLTGAHPLHERERPGSTPPRQRRRANGPPRREC